MKKQLLSILILGTTVTFAQNVNIPDANFKAYLVGESAINTNGDTEIQVSEAQAFTGTMMCVSKDVQDFTGVEEFVNITGANFSANDMVYLDISQNASLNTFYCSNCYYLSAVNMANGNNTNITTFGSDACQNLLNIQVDDVNWSNTNWTTKDANTNYTLDCSNTEINIPDANFKAILVNDAGINTNGDSEIQWTEALAYTADITCNQQSISSLTGLGTFISLNKLGCHTNSISSIDVSNNRVMTELDVRGNQLTSLYLAKNVVLTKLECGNVALSSIDITNNVNLVYFDCKQSLITTVDLSQNTELTTMHVYDNSHLSSLDVSNNPNLISLYCQYNALTSLDVSNNPVLENLYCNNNQLTSLNLANGNNMDIANSSLNMTSNPSLTCVEVDDAIWSTTNWTFLDAQTSFSEDCATVGTDQDIVESFELVLYPNPASTVLNIQSEELIDEVTVLDLSGKVLMSTTEMQINVEDLNSGVYLIKIQSNSITTTQPFVKK